MREIKEAFGFGNAICANGAMHYDLLKEEVIEEWLIPLDQQFEFVKRMRSAVPSISFATEYGDEFHHESVPGIVFAVMGKLDAVVGAIKAFDGKPQHPDDVPKPSGLVLTDGFRRDCHVIVICAAGEENRDADARL